MTLPALAVSILLISFVHSHEIRRIIGGKDSDIIKHPYQVQIVPVPKWTPQAVLLSSCSGAIVGTNVVLTAGHCTRKGKHHPNSYYIRAGTSYRSGKGGSLHRIIAIRVHKDFYLVSRRVHSMEDISLIFVDPPFVFDKTRRAVPIALTAANEGDLGVASGWGYTDTNATVHPKALQSTELMIISGDTCKKLTKWSNMVGDNNFCAGGDGLRSACKGDSGSPMVLKGRVVGIVSWGPKYCGKLGFPTVFTNVTYYIPWIKMETVGSDLIYV